MRQFLFGLATLIVAVIIVPIIFNYLFMWDSGEAKGETSDWFTFYGNIFGSLIGGFFTYLALMLTFKDQKEKKLAEMKPRIDIPHQTIEIKTDVGDLVTYEPISIYLNNTGGSMAKNIECKLSLPNYDEVLSALENDKENLQIDFIQAKTTNLATGDSKNSKHLMVLDDQGQQKLSLGSVNEKYDSIFIGTCIPLTLNHEAKCSYDLENNLSNWINYIVQKRSYSPSEFNKKQLFNLNLEVKYSSEEYGEYNDAFNLEWDFTGIWADANGDVIIKYVLKSTKVKKTRKIKLG